MAALVRSYMAKWHPATPNKQAPQLVHDVYSFVPANGANFTTPHGRKLDEDDADIRNGHHIIALKMVSPNEYTISIPKQCSDHYEDVKCSLCIAIQKGHMSSEECVHMSLVGDDDPEIGAIARFRGNGLKFCAQQRGNNMGATRFTVMATFKDHCDRGDDILYETPLLEVAGIRPLHDEACAIVDDTGTLLIVSIKEYLEHTRTDSEVEDSESEMSE